MDKKSRAKKEYKKAKIYQMEKSESRRAENSFQQILNKRKDFKNEIRNDFNQRKVPRRKYMGNPRPPPPPPEKPGLLSAIFGFSRQKNPGYSRRNDPNHNRRNKINRRMDAGRLNARTQDASQLPSKPVSTRRMLGTKQRIRKVKKPQSSGKQLFDGLELDFWEEETSLTTSPKPDYKRRWQNLTAHYIPKNQSATPATISDRLDSLSPVFSDWGSTMWAEIQEDWEDSDEQTVTDLTARYLNAWADVSRIGSLPRPLPPQDKVGSTSSARPPVENIKKPGRGIKTRTLERRKTPRRLRRPFRTRS